MMSIPRRLRSGCAVGTSKGCLANSFFSTALRMKQRACFDEGVAGPFVRDFSLSTALIVLATNESWLYGFCCASTI